MQIRIKRTATVSGKYVEPGAVVDVASELARSLISIGKADAVEPSEITSDRAVGLETSDTPKTTRRGGTRKR